MNWSESTIEEVFEFAHGKTILPRPKIYSDIHLYYVIYANKPNSNCDIVVFTDGTAVACLSSWYGPLSECTPDIDAEPPIWWIYK